MSDSKTIVCLANSRKPPLGGRCIAGKEWADGTFGGWVRPVSARPTHEISDEERRYEDGVYPQLLDVVEIPVRARAPIYHQKENIIIDQDYYWERAGRLGWADLRPALDHPASLWTNGDSTYHGSNDRVRLEVAAALADSLLLIAPEDLLIRVSAESSYTGPPRRRVRANFTYRGAYYRLVVTDPEVEQTLLARPNADYPLTDAYLCISLSEPNSNGDGACYKLAAAILARQPF